MCKEEYLQRHSFSQQNQLADMAAGGTRTLTLQVSGSIILVNQPEMMLKNTNCNTATSQLLGLAVDW